MREPDPATPPPENQAEATATPTGFAKQSMAILRLSLLAMRNRFGQVNRVFQGSRTATARKSDTKSWWLILLTLLMFGMAANYSYQGIHGLARQADRQWPSDQKEEVIRVDFSVYAVLLRFAPDGFNSATPPDEKNQIKELTQTIIDSEYLPEEAAIERALLLLDHWKQHGRDGFTTRSEGLYTPADFHKLTPEALHWLGRALALMLGFLIIALIFMPLSTRQRDLGSDEEELAWLFCLPLSGRVILLGKFGSAVLAKPLAWVLLWPFFIVLFWSMGFGPMSILIGLAASFWISFATAGVEVAVTSILRSRASHRTKKNVQSFATIAGTLGYILALAMAITSTKSSRWVNWILAHTPEVLTAEPGEILMAGVQGAAGMSSLFAVLIPSAFFCGMLGWWIAARCFSHGLSSGKQATASRLKNVHASQNPASLTRYEWLLLKRDRNLATTILVLPLIMIFYQVLMNPELLTSISAKKLAVITFGCGTWAALTTAPHVLISEARSLWIIFSLPVSIAEHFRRRSRIWRASALTMATTITVGLCVWKGFPTGEWWRIPMALLAVWVISHVTYALIMGKMEVPDPGQSERPHVGVGRIYGAMFISSLVGATLWNGTAWQILSSLVLWSLFGTALWQKVNRKLEYLLDPTESGEPKLTLVSALGALLIFSFVQGFFYAIASAFAYGTASSSALLYSYLAGGLAALGFCGWCRGVFVLPTLPPVNTTGVWVFKRLPVCTLLCITCGLAWLWLLRSLPVLHDVYNSAASQALEVHSGDWSLIVLAVVAAPLIEEFIFRKHVLPIMESVWTTRTAILWNALLFAAIHPALSFPPVFLLGLTSAWLYSRTRKLWPCILLHALYNAAVVAVQMQA